MDSEGMAEHLRECLQPEHYKTLVKAQEALGIPASMDVTSKKMHAARMWSEVLNDIHLIRLKAELKQAEQDLAANCSEENLERWQMFRAQVDSVQMERSKFYQEDPLPNAADG